MRLFSVFLTAAARIDGLSSSSDDISDAGVRTTISDRLSHLIDTLIGNPTIHSNSR